MNKKKLTALIAALSCIMCLTACAGNNAGSNTDAKDNDSKSSAASDNSNEELTSNTKLSGKDAIVPEDERSKGEMTDEQRNEYQNAYNKVLDDVLEYVNKHKTEASDNDFYSGYYSGPPEYVYQNALLLNQAKPNMRKLQISELKEYLRTHLDSEKGFDEFLVEKTMPDGTKYMGFDGTPVSEFNDEFTEWLAQIQAYPDVRGYLGNNYILIWCDADTITERREEIKLPETFSGWVNGTVTYRTFDENGTLLNEEVIIDANDHIYNF